MKIRDRNRKENAIPQSQSAVDRIFGGNAMIGEEVVQTAVTQSGYLIYEIPLKMIKARPVNDYAITGIDQLAESIQRTGLWQPIIVRKNDDPNDTEKKYVIVAGERRCTAMKLLHDRAEQDGDAAREKIYSSISGIILNDSDLDKEEQIYHDTNDYARQLTNFERITRLDPESIDMSDPEWQKKYVEECYGKDKVAEYESGDLKVKGNISEKCQYIVHVLMDKEPDLDISENTVRGYLAFLSRCGEALRQAILKGIVPLRDARDSLSWLSEEEQEDAVSVAGTEEYQDYIEEGNEKSAESSQPTSTDEKKEPEELITAASRISRKLYSSKKSFDKIYADTSYRRDLDDKQKAYIAQLRITMQAIDKLAETEKEMKEEEKPQPEEPAETVVNAVPAEEVVSES